jgi:hypothetical protein
MNVANETVVNVSCMFLNGDSNRGRRFRARIEHLTVLKIL